MSALDNPPLIADAFMDLWTAPNLAVVYKLKYLKKIFVSLTFSPELLN